ncbi:MAG TPA: ATP synthase F1 subunit gamma [Geobacteraceae bacterium]|nr:ATP synthase F1 subunit gamma [Geobacteraceae bacterium]
MASLKSIKKRIGTVKNSRQITKAMKMVAAAKLRRAQENVIAARPYARKLASVMQNLATSGGAGGHPLLQKDNSKKALLMVITSDRGLCGSFNANICKSAERFIKERSADYEELTVMTIGRKGNEYLKNRATIRKNYQNILSNLNYQTAALIAQEVIEGFLAGEYGEVHLLYNSFRSVMSQDITFVRLLPIAQPEGEEEQFRPEAIYEPGKEELLAELLPKHIEVQIFHALLESIAAEHGARMTAMDSATKNASEMIDKLTLQYNRARQAAITKELLEIIAGAESIKG